MLIIKRSEINDAIRRAKLLLEQVGFFLPSYGNWNCKEWIANVKKPNAIIKTMCGWDVTDFGVGNFAKIGAVLFTIRNGLIDDTSVGTPYAEKVMVLQHETEQEIPLHYHTQKTEDIINRGGGVLALELYNSLNGYTLDKATEVQVFLDGIQCFFAPGELIEITPGNSITLTPGIYHRFWAKRGAGDLVVGEISSINDDNKDNVFLHQQRRFPTIEEDAVADCFLVNEYPPNEHKNKLEG